MLLHLNKILIFLKIATLFVSALFSFTLLACEFNNTNKHNIGKMIIARQQNFL